MPVALRRRDLCGFARHRIRARRHDHGRSGMAGRDFGIDVVAVVGAVAGEGRYRVLAPPGSTDGQIITLACQRNGGALTLVPFHSSRFNVASEEGKGIISPLLSVPERETFAKIQ